MQAGPEFSELQDGQAELSFPGMDTWAIGFAGQWPGRGARAEAGALGASEADLSLLPGSAKPPGIAAGEVAVWFVTNLL